MGSMEAVGVNAVVGEADGASVFWTGLHAADKKAKIMSGKITLEIGFIGSIIPEV